MAPSPNQSMARGLLGGAALGFLAIVLHASPSQAAPPEAEQRLLGAITPRFAGEHPIVPIPPDLLEQATQLHDHGNTLQQALADIVLKDYAAADQLIQTLEKDPGTDAFDALTLDGDNWLAAGKADKAIAPYEKALALRPSDFQSANNAAAAHIKAHLGNLSDHQNRAIAILTGALQHTAPSTVQWALAQNNLGVAYRNLPTGDRKQNLSNAITALNSA